MKFTKSIFLIMLAAGVAVGGSNSYKVRLHEDVRIAGTDVKAGEYKVQLRGDMAAFKRGEEVIEVHGNLQNADKKFPFTTVFTDSNKDVGEIDFGGTSSRLVFGPGGEANK